MRGGTISPVTFFADKDDTDGTSDAQGGFLSVALASVRSSVCPARSHVYDQNGYSNTITGGRPGLFAYGAFLIVIDPLKGDGLT